MKLTEFFTLTLEREVARSRKVLEEMPDGKADWKPHEKSMKFGYLSQLVASMPSWLVLTIQQDALDLKPGSSQIQLPSPDRQSLVEGIDKFAAEARAAIQQASDEHLMLPWRLLFRGTQVSEAPRHEVIQDTFNHWAHHRGQMTVYLRLLGAKVPAIYGPSADDQRF